ncbi:MULTISPECIES: hypothetical protein [Salinibaculum]|uniref:hypothetical protein n=1 Tax=Salinibaculum TaxID=2732368 RepID=UPI0030D0D0BA
MGVAGLCEICESRAADHRCDRCGTIVCLLDYDAEMGLCADCAARAKPDDRRGDTFRL